MRVSRFALSPVAALFIGSLCALGCGSDSTAGDDDSANVDASSNDGSTTGNDGSSSVSDSSTSEDAGVVEDATVDTDGSTDAGTDASDAGDAGIAVAPFDLHFDAPVRAIVHAGNSWYIGGEFTSAGAVPAARLLATDLNGGASSTCATGVAFDGNVSAVLRVGNAIYVGGTFVSYKGEPAHNIAKLDATTCALDTTFSPAMNDGFDDEVSALATSGTSLYVGGSFTKYRGVTASANRLAKLDLTTGDIDTAFSPAGASTNGFSNRVTALLVSGTSLYAGGYFTQYRGAANSALRLAKLNLTTGAIDTTFSPAGAGNNGFGSGHVNALATSGTSLYIGHSATAYRGAANSSLRLAKVDLTSGVLDTTFSPPAANGFNSEVFALAVSGTSLYAGGAFTQYRGVASSALYLAKVDLTTGALDTTFTASGGAVNGLNDEVRALAVAGGSLYVGGEFSAYKGIDQRFLVKVNLTTAAAESFAPPGHTWRGVNNTVNALFSDGTMVYAGGAFTSYAGKNTNYLAKVDDATYQIDESFSPPGITGNGFDGPVMSIAADGASLFVGGIFTSYRGAFNSVANIAKLNRTTGVLDTTFTPAGMGGFDNDVWVVATAGTSVYVGGTFTMYRGVANSARGLAKLDQTSGAIDTAFSPPGATSNGVGGQVYALLPVGTSLYVGGDFTTYRDTATNGNVNRIAKVDLATGVLDATFSPKALNGFNGAVAALASIGTSVYAGGGFTAYKGVANSARNLAKLDGATGEIDVTFSPVGTGNGTDSSVFALATDGTNLFIGGAFSAYRSVALSATRIAKVNAASGAIDTAFSPVGAGKNGFGTGDFVYTLATLGNSLFVGGDLSAYRTTSPSRGMVKLAIATGAVE